MKTFLSFKPVFLLLLAAIIMLLVVYTGGIMSPLFSEFALASLFIGVLLFIAFLIRICVYYFFIENKVVQKSFILGGVFMSILNTICQFMFIKLMGDSAQSGAIIVFFVLSNMVFMFIELVCLESFWDMQNASLRRSMAFIHNVFTFCSVFILMLYCQMI